jgi:CHASE1-domain containing sensor protein
VVYAELKYQEQRRMARSFERASYDRIAAARETLDFDFLALEMVRVFYDGSDQANRHEFSVFVKPFIQGHRSVHVIEWVPRVLNSERSTFEKMAAKEGLVEFSIDEINSQGARSQVSDRREYFPVFFAEPADHSTNVLGEDLASIPACRIAMDKAQDTGQCVLTDKVTTPQKSGRGKVRAFLPVYQKNVSLNTLEDRRRGLEGYVVGVFNLEWIIKKGLASLIPAGVDVKLFDATDPSHLKLLCSESSRLEPQESKSNVVASPLQFSLRSTKSFDVAGRRWSVVCTATPSFLASQRNRCPNDG